jgi:hypothetical protein
MLDDVVDAVNGYLFTLVVLCLLTPVVLIRPFLMLFANIDRKTTTRWSFSWRGGVWPRSS